MILSAYNNTIWLRNRVAEAVNRRDDRGAALVEYAFLLVFIVVVCISAITFLGNTNNASVDNSATSIVAAN